MTKYAFLATIGCSYVHPGVYILTEAQASAMKARGWLFWPGCAEMTQDTTAASLGPQHAICRGWTLSSFLLRLVRRPAPWCAAGKPGTLRARTSAPEIPRPRRSRRP